MADERLKEIIKIASKLDWMVDNPAGYPLMQLSEVEKCMVAMDDDSELSRMREWYKDRIKRDEAIRKGDASLGADE